MIKNKPYCAISFTLALCYSLFVLISVALGDISSIDYIQLGFMTLFLIEDALHIAAFNLAYLSNFLNLLDISLACAASILIILSSSQSAIRVIRVLYMLIKLYQA
jgi:hypothetical protein